MTRELERAYRPERFRHPTAECTQRDVAVLVVAYRNPGLLRDCLASVEQHLGEVDVLVWDNSGPRFPGMAEVITPIRKSGGISARPTWDSPPRSMRWLVRCQSTTCCCSTRTLCCRETFSGTFAAIRKSGVAAAAPLVIDDSADPERYRPWDVAHREQSLGRALVSSAGYARRFRGRRCDSYENTIRPNGYPVGTPEEALDCTCGLYLNDPTARTQPLTN